MKKRIFLLPLVFLMSCQDFLNQEPQTALTQEQVFSKLENIDPLITGLYTSWRNARKDRGGFMFQLGGDESQQGAFQVKSEPDQAGLDRYDGFLAPRNNALTQQWDMRWPIVTAAAKAILALQTNKEDENRRNQLLGEASFIWAAVSFELTQYWGDIPVIDAGKIAELGTGRKPLPMVYDYLVRYLQFAADHLPESQTDKRRVTKYAAMALLGKVYLYAPQAAGVRDYQKAADQFQKVIQSGKYSLVPKYADLFDPGKANSTESLYEFQFTNTYPDNNQTQWQMGSRALASVDGNCSFGGYDLMVPTAYAYSDVSKGGVWETGDTRKDASIRYDFTYKGEAPKLLSGFGGDELDPHVKKFEDPRTQGTMSFWYSGKNIFYLRYADVLLCYAECLNELNRTSEAVTIVNDQIRNRAFGGAVPASLKWASGISQDDFRTKMLDERMRELAFEGWRRMDLIRSGKFVSLIKARNKWAAQSNTIQEFHMRYPIPLTEILQNEEIPPSAQNPGYQQ
ncbi:MAG: RagB/SusD family nutrient uptake outer membrane protein [Siphonobacter aquaeclarae]|nr:RagB/SusD family nutrient uptake outer membrane protein [Siphonobacter aquaeclarae]